VPTLRPDRADPAPRPRVVPVALLALLLAALFLTSLVAASDPGLLGIARAGDAVHPALPADVADAPLARPAPAPRGTGGFTLLEREDDGSGRPVRWDPCRPIHYVIRPDGEPSGGRLAIETSIARIERLTGLRFTYDGPTGERPSRDRSTVDVPRYGDRWSPVLIAWTDPHEYPQMAGYAGLGGPDAVSGGSPGRRRYVTGVVLLNRAHLSEVVRWPDGSRQLEAVVLHEFGHLVGLDHVGDPGQLMYKQPTVRPGGFGDGDRRGLALLSDGPCYRDF
jgi:Matrixin